jgi:hypothetical protein
MRGNNQTLSGYFLGAELLLSPRPHAMIAGHLDAIARGELKVVIDQARSHSPTPPAAHAYIESRQILRPGAARPLEGVPVNLAPRRLPASVGAMTCSERLVR